MKKILVAFLFFMTTSAWAIYPVTDALSGSGPLSSNWSGVTATGYVSLVRSSGTAIPSVSSSQGMAAYTGTPFSSNQSAQIQFSGSTASGGNTGPCVRVNGTGDGVCYVASYGYIYVFLAGVGYHNVTSACPIPSSGDVLRLSVTGATYTCTNVTTGISASADDGNLWLGNPGLLVDQQTTANQAVSQFQADCSPSCNTTYPAVDAFSGSGLASSNWTNTSAYGSVYGPLAQSGGTAVPSTSGGQSLATFTGKAFTNDQYSQALFVSHTSVSNSTGVCVRFDDRGNGPCYFPEIGQIVLLNNGAGYTNITTSCPVPSSGDTVRLTVVGTTFTCTNITTGVSATASDTTYTHGAPGILISQANSAFTYALAQFQADCSPSCSSTTTPPTFSPAGGTYASAQSVTITSATPSATIYYTTDGSTPTTGSAVYSGAIPVNVSQTVKAIALAPGYAISTLSSASYTISVPAVYPVTDAFSGSGALSSNWTNVSASGYLSLIQSSGSVVPTGLGNKGIAFYSGVSFGTNTDQYSQFVVPIMGAIGATGPCVRMDAAGTGYCWLVAGQTIFSVIGGSGTAPGAGYLSACPSVSVGDTVRLSAVGTTLTCTNVTTSTSLSTTDTSHTSGAPGMLVDQGASNSAALQSFQADCAPSSCVAATAPTFSPSGGIFSSAQTVTISTVTSGAVIYYTTDGSTPTGSSAVYSGAITVAASQTIKAIAVASGYATSAVSSAAYTINATVGTPTFSPPGGTYSSAQTVTISSSTPSSTIYYTANGATPTPSSSVYSGPITVSTSETLMAIATASGYSTSAVGTAVYTIGGSTGGQTWYIRPDGGTRYSTNQTNGQCDGKGDAAYGGSGTNQHCAFNDYRFLYDDQTYTVNAWVISGGDTVILRGGPWRVGFSQGASPNDTWCAHGTGPFDCTNPPVPAGTATQHTRILGENYGSCNATNKTQIFGGFGVGVALNLGDTQYVDVSCMEITRHSDCIRHGYPAYPSGCSSSYPLDDYDGDGITTTSLTHDLTLTDLWIHGHTDRGIIGPIGANVTCLRCNISYNGMGGWDFDNGYAAPFGANASWNFLYSQIEWNGCNQEYPITHTFPAISCYGQSSGGYGDGVGTPAGTGTGMTVLVDHSTFDHNTQDGIDLGHMDAGNNTLTFTNSYSYANNGGALKWGAYFQTATVVNNLLEANCFRMSAPISGAPSTFNTNLGDFCRAQDGVSFNFLQNATAILANNTVVSYAPTTFDINCWDTSCSNSVFNFENNLVLAYDNPVTYNSGGQSPGPGGFFYQATIGTVNRNNNLYYGIRNISCPTGFSGEICVSPGLVNQPITNGSSFVETQLDSPEAGGTFSFHLSSASAAIGAGTAISGITTDYSGATRPVPPSIGALEY